VEGEHVRPSKHSEKEKMRREIVKFAVMFCREPETIDAYESLEATNSASAPASFMRLYEAVEDYRRPAQAKLRNYIQKMRKP
jgi:hypothetical protein